MKTTALTELHISLGAKMNEFAGYNMPIYYSNISEEHNCVRSNLGLFDVSHMGQFIIKGKEALDLVQKVTSNDASKLKIGQAQYSLFPNATGGVVDDLIVYRLNEDQCSEGEQAFMMVVNASNIKKDWEWITSANTFDTRIIDISERTSLLALQGPKAILALQKLTDIDLDSIGFYHFTKGNVGGIENVLISATGYTGSGGFELYLENKDAKTLWNLCMEAGNAFGIMPVGLGARDTLRMEKGYCLYGHEIDENTSPLEAGLSWIIKTKKEADFFSKAQFIAQKEKGFNRKLVGLKLNDRRVPRQGYEVVDQEGNAVGIITSGTMSPSLNIPIAIAYVEKNLAEEGTQLNVQIRNKQFDAVVTKLPILK